MLGIPLIAAIFGRKKLAVEPVKVEVDEATRLLRVLIGSSGDGAMDQVERMFRNAAREIAAGSESLDPIMRPILEFICTREANGWLFLAQIYEESGQDPQHARAAIKQYLQMTPRSILHQRQPWERLATLCERTDDFAGCVDALAALCELPGMALQHISSAADRVVKIVSGTRYKSQSLECKQKVKQTIARIIEVTGSLLQRM